MRGGATGGARCGWAVTGGVRVALRSGGGKDGGRWLTSGHTLADGGLGFCYAAIMPAPARDRRRRVARRCRRCRRAGVSGGGWGGVGMVAGGLGVGASPAA